MPVQVGTWISSSLTKRCDSVAVGEMDLSSTVVLTTGAACGDGEPVKTCVLQTSAKKSTRIQAATHLLNLTSIPALADPDSVRCLPAMRRAEMLTESKLAIASPVSGLLT
jgi:hypothetical protein